MLILASIALIAWLTVLLLPWQAHRARECFEPSAAPTELDDVTVLIPARNEAEHIESTLKALARQGSSLQVIVVNDESSDDTADVCRRLSKQLASVNTDRFALNIVLVEGCPLPDAWGGKLWALHQGLDRIDRPYTLLLDAEIELSAKVLPSLLQFARSEELSLLSIMARLRCNTVWERLLTPPFIYFFKLLYPFALVNTEHSTVAAAAGGCILIRTDVLHSVGGFEEICAALIDDCALASQVKKRHGKIWLGLSQSVRSMRSYSKLSDFWQMVSRTAFTQLRYSMCLLLLTSLVMLVVFLAPMVLLGSPNSATDVVIASLALVAMAASYWPTVSYYQLSVLWVLTLPLAAILFLAMTWSSAFAYWRGTRARWKNRAYQVSD